MSRATRLSQFHLFLGEKSLQKSSKSSHFCTHKNCHQDEFQNPCGLRKYTRLCVSFGLTLVSLCRRTNQKQRCRKRTTADPTNSFYFQVSKHPPDRRTHGCLRATPRYEEEDDMASEILVLSLSSTKSSVFLVRSRG